MFEFSIVASGLDPRSEDFETRFYEAGCDDATVSFQKGHIILDFNRDAESFDAALASAIENVTAAGASVVRIEPDPLVSLADIAGRTGMSRAAMTHYSKGNRARDFPAPVARVTSDSPLWDWPAVAVWMFRHGRLPRDQVVQAVVVKCANDALRTGARGLGGILKQRAEDCEATL